MSARSSRTPVPSLKVKEGTGTQPGAQSERREAAPSATSVSFIALADRTTPEPLSSPKKKNRSHPAQIRATRVSSRHLGNQSRWHHFERVLHCNISGRGCCVEHGRCVWRELRGGAGSDRICLAHPRPTETFSAEERAQNRANASQFSVSREPIAIAPL